MAFRTSIHSASSATELQRIESHQPSYSYEIHDGYLCSLNRYHGCATRYGGRFNEGTSEVMPTRGLGDLELEPGQITSPSASCQESAGFLAATP